MIACRSLTIVAALLATVLGVACAASAPTPDHDDANLPDTGRLNAQFDAYGYQVDHDVRDGIVDWSDR